MTGSTPTTGDRKRRERKSIVFRWAKIKSCGGVLPAQEVEGDPPKGRKGIRSLPERIENTSPSSSLWSWRGRKIGVRADSIPRSEISRKGGGGLCPPDENVLFHSENLTASGLTRLNTKGMVV